MLNDYGYIGKAIANVKEFVIAVIASFSAIAFAGNEANTDELRTIAFTPKPPTFRSTHSRKRFP